jgi:hypothetical protein
MVTKKCCPLCDGKVDEDMYHYVKYVTSSEENMEAYFNGKLTYLSWRKMMLKALGVK